MSYGVEIGDRVLIRGFITKRDGSRIWVQMDRAEGMVIQEWFDAAYLLPEAPIERVPVIDGRNSVEYEAGGNDPHDEWPSMR